MLGRGATRRQILLGAASLTATGALPARVLSAAPPAEAITPALIEAARKEGQVNWYTAMDLPVAEALAKVFEGQYSGIKVQVERAGSERLFQRIGQEVGGNIRSVDIVNTADA